MRLPHLLVLLLAPVAAGCFAACTSSSMDASARSSARGESPPVPWTRDFQDPAVLVAEEVFVQGPPGLLDHFAMRVDPDYHDRREETTSAGYLQLVETKPGLPVEIRGYLDQLEIAAFRRLRVLESPGDIEVSVEARGEVYFARRGTGEERRVPSLRLIGRRSPDAFAGGR